MTTKVSVETQEQANYVLAVDMTALWKRKTTGIQRVIREMMPHLAAAAAARSWDVVMVRKTEKGLEELVRCTGRYDEAKLMLAIESIARGQIQISTRLTAGIAQYVYQVMRAIGQLKVGKLQIRNAIRSIRLLVPSHIRSRIRSWRRKRSIICQAADAYISFSGGILPAMPPACTPPERTVIVIHDLIPLHYSAYYSAELSNAFVRNLAEIAFSPSVTNLKLLTASRFVAADIEVLFYAMARKPIKIGVVEWGYDAATFFPQPDVNYRLKLGIPTDALLVAAVSTQDARKRFADIEKAIMSMDAYAVFLGQGQPRREGNAIYLGYVSDDELRWAYSSSDVVVNWSAAEGFGLSTIEALACGARVVVPPDNPTSIEVGGNDVVVAKRADIPALCDAIRLAANMPSPQPNLTRFNWSTTAATVESILWPETAAH